MLDDLFSRGHVAIRRGAIFDVTLPAPEAECLRSEQRIEGMILGLAVGDALGHSTEWKYDPEKRWQEFGTITDHVGTFLSPPGRISDDTQLSLWTLERLLATGSLDIHDLVRCLTDRRHDIVGAGRNTTAALSRHHQRLTTGSPEFHLCGGDPVREGRGNGALMRFSPLILPWLRYSGETNPSARHASSSYWSDVVLASFITHPHAAALSSVVAFASLLWNMFLRDPGATCSPEWWLDEYLRVAGDLEMSAIPDSPGPETLPDLFRGFQGTLCDFLDTRFRKAWRSRMSLRDACSLKGFGSGADCLQTVPAVLYVLMSHADSFESAMIAAVNDTKDNDTIASITGAMLGALHGQRAVRQRWIDGIRSSSLAVCGSFAGNDRTIIRQLARDAAHRFGA